MRGVAPLTHVAPCRLAGLFSTLHTIFREKPELMAFEVVSTLFCLYLACVGTPVVLRETWPGLFWSAEADVEGAVSSLPPPPPPPPPHTHTHTHIPLPARHHVNIHPS